MSNPFAFWKWRWDTLSGSDIPVKWSILKRNCGPISVYRYRVTVWAKGKETPLTWWMLCPWDGVSFGGHLPDVVARRLEAWMARGPE